MSRFLMTLVVFSLALVSAFGQTSVAVPVPTTQSAIQVISAIAYPGPVVTATAGKAVEIQFEAVLADGRHMRNLVGVPVVVQLGPSSKDQNVQMSCNLVTGLCKVSADKAGPVQIGLTDPTGSWGYFGSTVIIDFLPPVNPFQPYGREVLSVTASTVQAGEREVVTVFSTVPRDLAGYHSMVVSGLGPDSRQLNFQTGLKLGQRVKVAEIEVLPSQQMGSYGVSISLRDNYGNEVMSGYGNWFAKSGYQSFSATLDDFGNIQVKGMLPVEPNYRLALTRGDGFYLPLSVNQYQTGDGMELVFYNGSNGFAVDLPLGYYGVAIIGEYSGQGGVFCQTVPNALYLPRQIRLQ